MFESVKQDSDADGIRYLASLLVSLLLHAVIICLLIVVPLVFFNVLQAQELLTFLVEPPVPPPAPPPPAPPVSAAGPAHRVPVTAPYGAPREIPDGIPPAEDAVAEPMDPSLALSAIAGIPGGGQTVGTGKSIVSLVSEPIKIPDPPRPGPKPAPIRIGALEQSKLIFRVNPVYPALAVKAHIQGTVILEAVVNEEGSIATLKVLSGHAFLVDAAVQAVRQWKYSPTVLNGEPVPVIATITVVFRLD